MYTLLWTVSDDGKSIIEIGESIIKSILKFNHEDHKSYPNKQEKDDHLKYHF